MTPQSAILDDNQKQILRESIFMYVSDLQKKFYREKQVDAKDYNKRMQFVSEIVDVLHLKNYY